MNKFQYYPAFPGKKQKAFTVSYDDGWTSDERLVDLLRKHHAKGTFNLNSTAFASPGAPKPAAGSFRRMTVEECLALYGEDMEIAVHGAKHPFWTMMNPVNIMQDILDDKRTLEQLFGRIIRGAAVPYGAYNDAAANILKDACFAYCRNTGASKSLRFSWDDPLHFQATVRHRDEDALRLARKFADATSPRGRLLLYCVSGHTYEFMQNDNWELCEELLNVVCDREDIWYCTLLELFDYLTATKRLNWSVEGTTVQNPSACDVFLRKSYCIDECDPELVPTEAEYFCIPAGKTVRLPAE